MPLVSLALVVLSAAMHAGWNMLVREQRRGDMLLRMAALTAVLGLGPALAADALAAPVLTVSWAYILAGGVCLAL